MNLKRYVFTESWRVYKCKLKHSSNIQFKTVLSRQYSIAKLLIENGLTKFYTD